MRAGLAAPDASIIHARQVVEHKRGRLRELYPTSRGKDALKGVVAKDLAGRNRNERTPAMSTAERAALATSVAGTSTKILDGAPEIRLGGVVAHSYWKPCLPCVSLQHPCGG